MRPSKEAGHAYVATFYPGARAQDEAQTIRLEPGLEQYDVDFALVSSRTVRIAGKVVDPARDNLEGVRVSLRGVPSASDESIKIELDARGAFDSRDVVPGPNKYLLTYTQTIARNKYTDKATVGFSNVLARIQVPVARRLALQLDTGLSLDTWGFVTLGARHRLFGDGGRGSWYLSGAFGVAMIVDKSPCDYNATVPCGASATSYGPTVSFGLEYRF